MKIQIMDTTLRDGEQTSGVAYNEIEKLSIAKMLLEDVKVDRIEIASSKVSQGEFESVKKITSWAKQNDFIRKIEILGFVDGDLSLNWIHEAGGKVVNLLCKGSLRHLEVQLRKKPEEHIADIKKVIQTADKLGISVNVYLEDWSNGMKNSPEYVAYYLDHLKNENIQRFMLADTLGVLNPADTYEYCSQIVKGYPGLRFDFHAHNDYDMAVANSFEAIVAGCTGIHSTVNGLGERAGNAPLASIVTVIRDQLNLDLSIDETKLHKISKLVETFSGIRIPYNKPVVGEHVFTQVCGVHADGDNKGNLYCNKLIPERFDRKREYALGKSSGKASIKKNLEELGIDVDADTMKKVTDRVIALGNKKRKYY